MKKRGILLSHVRQLMMSVCVNMRMNDCGGGRDSVGNTGGMSRQRRLRLRRVKRVAVTCNKVRVATGMADTVSSAGSGSGSSTSTSTSTSTVSGATVRRAVIVMMMAEDDPRESHGSLMMLRGTVCVVRLRDHVVTRGWRVCGARMMMTAGSRVMIRIVGATIVVIVILLLPLTILLVLHPSVLKPYLHLPLGQVQVARELPSFLLRHVRVEQKLFFKFECLELGVRFAFLPYCHLPGPLQRVRASTTDAHSSHSDTDADSRQGTCGKQGRWGGTPHHLTQLVCR